MSSIDKPSRTRNWTDGSESMAERVAKEMKKIEKEEMNLKTEDNQKSIVINFNPTIVVEGQSVTNSLASETTDNRTKSNPSLSEVGALITGLVGAILPFIVKNKKC